MDLDKRPVGVEVNGDEEGVIRMEVYRGECSIHVLLSIIKEHWEEEGREIIDRRIVDGQEIEVEVNDFVVKPIAREETKEVRRVENIASYGDRLLGDGIVNKMKGRVEDIIVVYFRDFLVRF